MTTSSPSDSVAEYATHFVAFIDILGYKELVLGVRDSAEALPKILKLKAAIQRAATTFARRTEWQKDDLAVQIFSDSIVLAVRATIDNFDAFFQLIAEAQANLAREGVLVRGGLAIGRHYADETITFSEALIKAYTLESTIARWPRIVVPDEFRHFVSSNGYDEDIIWFHDTYTWPDLQDDALFVDYLNFMPYTQTNDPDHRGRDLLNHRELVIAGLAAHQKAPGTLAKFRWLAGYHDDWCSKEYPAHPELLIGHEH